MDDEHLIPDEAREAAQASVSARQGQLARELTSLGIPAAGVSAGATAPGLRDEMRPGVWLRAEDAELAARVLQWAKSRGLIITREHFGLPGEVTGD